MKIVELVEILSIQEIEELVDSGIEIEDIQYLLLHKDEGIKQRLFENEKLKQFLLKQINLYILTLLENYKNNIDRELSEDEKKIIETYLKMFYKDGIELDIANEIGRNIVSTIMELANRKTFISALYQENDVWSQYARAIRRKTQEDIFSMPKEQVLKYNIMFGKFFRQSVIGDNIPEEEAALKITQREDIDIREPMALDMLSLRYIQEKQSAKREMIREDQVFSIILDKEIFDQITEAFPNLKDSILKQIDAHIYSILKDILDKQRKITPEEMQIYSKYLSDYFEISLEKNFDTKEMVKLFSLMIDLAYPQMAYNMQKLKGQDETVAFLKKEFGEKQIFEKYDAKIQEIIKKWKLSQTVTPEEFKKYDEIFCEYSYRTSIDDADNIKIIEELEKRSKELQLPSKTIENQIEKYIQKCLENKGNFEHSAFWETIFSYYERQLQGTAIEINNNAAVSHLIRVAQIGKLPQNISTRILEKLEERKKKSQTVDVADTENLEKYMQSVAEIRLQQGRMPRECCEFIIKQSILKNKV